MNYLILNSISDAWKLPINLTNTMNERLKRFKIELASNEPKPKKIRKYEPLEILPEEIVCNEKPEQVPRVLFSRVDNVEGLKNAVA